MKRIIMLAVVLAFGVPAVAQASYLHEREVEYNSKKLGKKMQNKRGLGKFSLGPCIKYPGTKVGVCDGFFTKPGTQCRYVFRVRKYDRPHGGWVIRTRAIPQECYEPSV